jgi:hypothetical protein
MCILKVTNLNKKIMAAGFDLSVQDVIVECCIYAQRGSDIFSSIGWPIIFAEFRSKLLLQVAVIVEQQMVVMKRCICAVSERNIVVSCAVSYRDIA